MSNRKTGRNDPCPCDSGLKYKKCCLEKDQLSKKERIQEARSSENTGKQGLENQPSFINPFQDKAQLKAETESAFYIFEESDLDYLSNHTLDLINLGEFKEAEECCQKLLDKYPKAPDGFLRFSSLYEAMGKYELAADYLEKAMTFMKQTEGFDVESIKDLEADFQRFKKLSKSDKIEG